ncbi:MAG TPA: zf-HC2 domain-containing protein [Terriglobales bacterium]|nr:zf-HC2 domain-containing protein [Terriglobales bacterium]
MSSLGVEWNGRTGEAPAECEALQPALSAYMDGELDSSTGALVVRHLERCARCAATLQSYREMGQWLRQEPAPAVPADLALRLRVKASHYSVRGQRWQYWKMRWTAALQALAVPTAVGTAAALVLFSALAGGVHGSRVGNPAVPDVQIGDATPPRLARVPDYDLGAAVLIKAEIDATGHVYGYSVLSGPTDAQLISRLNNQLLLSVFEPATTFFGQPTTGSLLVSFGTVSVRG